MYPENPEGTKLIVGCMNMGFVSDTARTRSRNLFRPKCVPIPLGHSDGRSVSSCFLCLQVMETKNMLYIVSEYAENGEIFGKYYARCAMILIFVLFF